MKSRNPKKKPRREGERGKRGENNPDAYNLKKQDEETMEKKTQ